MNMVAWSSLSLLWIPILSWYVVLITYCIVALYLADQTLLSTIAPVSIIFSLILGRYMLKETIYKKHFYSCGFMIVGAMVALMFAHMDSNTYDVHDIEKRIYSDSSIAMVSGIVTMMVVLMIV